MPKEGLTPSTGKISSSPNIPLKSSASPCITASTNATITRRLVQRICTRSKPSPMTECKIGLPFKGHFLKKYHISNRKRLLAHDFDKRTLDNRRCVANGEYEIDVEDLGPSVKRLRMQLTGLLPRNEHDDALDSIFRSFPNLMNGSPPFSDILTLVGGGALYLNFVRAAAAQITEEG